LSILADCLRGPTATRPVEASAYVGELLREGDRDPHEPAAAEAWADRLRGAPTITPLPQGLPGVGLARSSIAWHLSIEAVAMLRATAYATRSSVFTGVLAGVAASLHDGDDIDVVFPVYFENRQHPTRRAMVGLFASSAPIRVRFDQSANSFQRVAAVSTALEEARCALPGHWECATAAATHPYRSGELPNYWLHAQSLRADPSLATRAGFGAHRDTVMCDGPHAPTTLLLTVSASPAGVTLLAKGTFDPPGVQQLLQAIEREVLKPGRARRPRNLPAVTEADDLRSEVLPHASGHLATQNLLKHCLDLALGIRVTTSNQLLPLLGCRLHDTTAVSRVARAHRLAVRPLDFLGANSVGELSARLVATGRRGRVRGGGPVPLARRLQHDGRMIAPLHASEAAATAMSIARTQESSGAFAWDDGHVDVWNHIECAMALAAAGHYVEAASAYRWAIKSQSDDGTWAFSFRQDSPSDRSVDVSQCAYFATGVWHWWLVTGDLKTTREFWPAARRGLMFALEMAASDGHLHWSRRADGEKDPGHLVSGSSSVFLSLRCGLALSRMLGEGDQPQWRRCLGRLAHAFSAHPERFLDKSEMAMDWYYPVLTGVVRGQAAAARIDTGWDSFVEDEFGVRCSRSRPWVTAAETSELALTLAVIGRRSKAAELLRKLRFLRTEVGAYHMGADISGGIRLWPDERPNWTASAVILAADALAGGHTLRLFRGDYFSSVEGTEACAAGCSAAARA
jgi:hypothetical protein